MNVLSYTLRLVDYVKDPLRKNAIFLTASAVLNALIGFFFWMLAARFYSTEQVGLSTAVISALSLVVTFTTLGFDIGLVRFLPREEDKEGMMNSCLTIAGLASMILAVAFIGGVSIWSPALVFLQSSATSWLAFTLIAVAGNLSVVQTSLFVAYRATKYQFVRVIIMGLKILMVAVLVSFGVLGIFSAWGIAEFLSVIAGVFFIMKLQGRYRPVPEIKTGLVKKLLRFSLGNYIAESLLRLPRLLLPIMVVNVLDSEAGAYFYMAWMVGTLLFMIPRTTSLSLLAEGTHKPDELLSQVVKATKFVLLLLIPAILIVFFLGDFLLTLFGEQYSENALRLLWIMAASSIPIAFNEIYISITRVQNRVRPVVAIYAFVALFTLIGSYFLMKQTGLVGIGLAWLVANGIVTVVVAIPLLKSGKIPFKRLLSRE